eukprot:gb/GEZN01000969.1/.p1 GENE.gb/GEZN01000969.1/~~gb/GEZN01000969.1/.p1  ORF type:complete len:981 (-),score=285.36 gb/GEZN01000969.1/:438-3380(-)
MAFAGFGDVKTGGRSFKAPKKGKKPKVVSKNKETINELNDSLGKQPKFAKMALYSISCLDKLAVDEVSAEELITEGTVERLMEILRANPDNEEIHAAVNNCLRNMAKTERLAQMIADRMNGQFDPFVQSLTDHKKPSTLISSCGIVAKLVKSSRGMELRDRMSRQGMVAALCNVVKNNADNVDLVQAATEALERFAHQPGQAGGIIRSGAVPIIIEQANTHLDREEFVAAAASMLAGLSKYGSKEDIETLKKSGAVDFLINALETHPFNDDLLASATEALKFLTGVTDMGLAMQAVTTGDVRLDAKTASALSKIAALSLVPENLDYMYKEHGVDWLLAVLKGAVGQEGADASKILSNGCRILQRANRNEDDIYNLMKKGAVPLLLAIINGHMDDQNVVESALNALSSMATRKENAAYLAKKDALGAALNALKKHPKSEAIARGALNLFQAMASHPDTGNQLVAAGGIPAIMEAMKNHRDHPDVLLAAIQTLGRMATSEGNVKAMVDAGMLPELLQVLQDHPDKPELSKMAMMALDTAMLLPDTAAQLRSLGAIDTIDNVMQVNPDDLDIQGLGQKLIDDINGEKEREKVQEMEAAKQAQQAEEERLRQLHEDTERERMAQIEAERGRMAAEEARLREMEAKKQADAEDRIKKARAEKERLAELAKIQAEKERRLEQEALDREMAEALSAMKASEESARLRRIQEQQNQLDDAQRGKHAAEMEAQRLKALDENKRLDELARRREDLERMRRDLNKEKEKAKDGAIHDLLARQEAERNKKETKVKLKKSAREIFDPDDDKDKMMAELPIPIKNFLMAGQLLMKHSKTAAAKPMHLYLSHDVEYMVWKSPDKEVQMKQRMRIYKLHGVNVGRCTPQLQRKRYNKWLIEDEDCCFSMYGADLFDEERTVDMECETKKECQTWVHALETLIAYAKNKQMYGQKTMAVKSKKELNKLGHKSKLDEDPDSDNEEDGMVMNKMADLTR